MKITIEEGAIFSVEIKKEKEGNDRYWTFFYALKLVYYDNEIWGADKEVIIKMNKETFEKLKEAVNKVID